VTALRIALTFPTPESTALGDGERRTGKLEYDREGDRPKEGSSCHSENDADRCIVKSGHSFFPHRNCCKV